MCETPGSAAASPEAALTLYYQEETCFFQGGGLTFPSRSAMIRLIQELRLLLFPGYFASEPSDCSRESFAQHHVCLIRELLVPQLLAAFGTDADAQESSASALRAEQSAEEFLMRLPSVGRLLQTDIRAAFDGDPAARSREEIILAYPGFFAVLVYRLAHELHLLHIPLLPRMMTEYAHSLTGIDIHPGAQIGEYFFMDHGTGIVIGETTVIGHHVKLYQGVTLGAVSTRAGKQLAGIRRHPTIEDYVTIYSNASILGGATVIGQNSVIGGNAFLTASVPPNSRIGRGEDGRMTGIFPYQTSAVPPAE